MYGRAFQYYTSEARDKVDVVIDEINTAPFLTPLYAKQPVISLIHQLAREFWFFELRPPFSWLGYLAEPWYLKIYQKVPTVALSESTKQDLVRLGFQKVFVIPAGIGFSPRRTIPQKEEEPTLLYVGRLERAKRPDHAIQAFHMVKKEMPAAKLWIVGDGTLRQRLQDTASQDIHFFGWVSESRKLELMSRAHVLLAPYLREGWGLVVTEANACGTPAIGYNVPGLKDSIRDGETGLLTKENTLQSLAQLILQFFQDGRLREQLTQTALEWSGQFSWDKYAHQFTHVLDEVVEGRVN